VRAQPDSNGKVGIIGTCSGGRHAVVAASRAPGKFDAVADLWGGGVVAPKESLTPKQPVAPVDYTKDLNVPLLGLFGNDDQRHHPPTWMPTRPSSRSTARLRVPSLRRRRPRLLLLRRPMYRQQQAMDGWNKVFDFFNKHSAKKIPWLVTSFYAVVACGRLPGLLAL